MPSLPKLAIHSNSVIAQNGKNIAVFGVHSQGLESLMECTDVFSNLQVLIGSESEKMDSSGSSSPPRKRQRLDHLSQEEKVMRRKLKNRVAAQSARDRKKAKMSELEEQVANLEAQTKFLLIENAELRNKNAELEKQNAELKLRLGLESCESSEVKKTNCVSTQKESVKKEISEDGSSEKVGSLEYASLISGPLLKEQDLQLLTLWMMRYVYLPAIARLMTFLMCFNSAVISYCSLISVHPNLKNLKAQPMNHPATKWWGAHQRAWNPSKN